MYSTQENLNKALLEIKNLTVDYYAEKKVTAIRNISLRINETDKVGILGESGSGKTTLALAILNLIMPYEGKIVDGEIIFENKDILKMNEEELRQVRGKKITMVFQDPYSVLNPVIRIREQVEEIIKYHNLKITLDEIISLLKTLKFTEPMRILNSYPHQISGGERQRVCIAMAILPNPNLLIADEPTSAVDTITQQNIISILKELYEKYSLTVLFITHNPLLIKSLTNKTIIMYKGEIVESGETEEIFKQPMHPYTQDLLSSLIKPNDTDKKLKVSVNFISNVEVTNGCSYFPKCSKRDTFCKSASVILMRLKNRNVRCLKV